MFFTKLWHTSIFFLLSRKGVCTKLSRGYESPQMSPKPGLQIPLQACFRQPELREAGLKLWHPENGNLPDWVCLHSAAQSCAWCLVTFLDTASLGIHRQDESLLCVLRCRASSNDIEMLKGWALVAKLQVMAL